MPVAAGLAAVAIAMVYVYQVYAVSDAFGFPLDDSYIYLTYAKQIARGQPFTYFDGSGYSAGSTSMLWPVVLAPLWLVGLRGYLFTFASFGLCTVLLATTAGLGFHIARQVLGARYDAQDDAGSGGQSWAAGMGVGALATALIVTCAPLTWAALAGMEVALATTLLFASAAQLMAEGDRATPSRRTIILLAATTLSRPEAGLVVAAVVGIRAILCVRARAWRTVGLWLLPLAAPIFLACLNKLLAGYFTPNTAVAKSHFYVPAFDWGYYFSTLGTQTKAALEGLFWSSSSPLVAPRIIALLWLVGAIRLLLWGRKTGRATGAALLVLAPLGVLAGVLVASGLWNFQNYRYIAAGLPALFLVAAMGLAVPRRIAGRQVPTRVAHGLTAALCVAAVLVVFLAWPRLHKDMKLWAQGVRDTNAQVVRIGQWIDANLPDDAHVAFHDAGAIAYYGERRFTDIIGLISNHRAVICNHGPGARFESLERMAPEDRPTHFAYYDSWLIAGSRDLYGQSLLQTPLPAPIERTRRLVGGGNMQIFEARWDVLESGHAPLHTPTGWRVVDRLDVADMASEAAHDYVADMGGRRFGDPTARWSLYLGVRTQTDHGEVHVSDGGRTIRGPDGERFTLTIEPDAPLRLMVRLGGPTSMPRSRIPAKPRTLVVERTDTGAVLGTLEAPRPDKGFRELTLDIPADPSRPRSLRLRVSSPDAYRTFQYFALQPDGS